MKGLQLKSWGIDNQGNYVINQLVHHVKPYWLVPRNTRLNPNNPEQVQMAAGAWSAPVPMYVVDEGAFEGAYFTCERDGPCLVRIHDDVRKRRITGRPCHVDTIFGGVATFPIGGDGLAQLVLPESIWLDKREALIMDFFNLNDTEVNDIRPVLHGQRLFVGRARSAALDKYCINRNNRARFMLPYVCPLDIDIVDDDVLAAGAQQVYYFTQQATAHFEVKKINYISTYDFKFKIEDESGQSLTSDWVHCEAGLGTARMPGLLFGAWMIRAAGIVKWTIQNLSADYANTIYLTKIGREIFV